MPDWLLSVILALIGSGAVGVWFERRLRAAETKRTQAESEKIEAEEAQTYAAVSAAQNTEWQRLYDLQSNKVAALETTIRHEYARAAEQEEKLIKLVDTLRVDVARIERELLDKEQEKQALTQRNTALTNRVKDLESQVHKLTIENATKDEEIRILRLQLEQLTARLAQIEKKTGTGELTK